MARLKFNKEDLLNSEFGKYMVERIDTAETFLRAGKMDDALTVLRTWHGIRAALKFMYGVDYMFTREDGHYGIVNEADDADWLYYMEV